MATSNPNILRRPVSAASYSHDTDGPGRYRAVAGAYTHMLADWTVVATLTFEVRVSDARADASFTRWARTIAREVAREHLTVAWASGYQTGGGPHFHALVALPSPIGVSSATLDVLAELWRASASAGGFAVIRAFDPNRGAAWYLAGHGDIAFAIACPRTPRCRRRLGCRVTSCPL